MKVFFRKLFERLFTRDVWVRSGKTFVQAALGYLATAFPALTAATGDAVGSALVGLLLSPVSAGACAMWNGVLQPVIFPPEEGGHG